MGNPLIMEVQPMPNLSDLRITPEDIAQHGVIAAPDILRGTPAENKALFDRLIREHVALAVNGMLDALEAMRVIEPFSPAREYVPYNQAVWDGSTYQCREACTGIYPDDTRYWLKTAARGADGGGAGDMRAEVYDREGRALDVYAYAMPKAPDAAGQLLAADEDGSAAGCGILPEEVVTRSPDASPLTVYTAPGTYTFTAPGTGWYFVRAVGAGSWGQYGGSGGGYAEKLVRLQKDEQVTVTVGAGGRQGNSPGGSSSFGAHVTAQSGGSGGGSVGADTQVQGGGPGGPSGNFSYVSGASFMASYGGAWSRGYGVGANATDTATDGLVTVLKC